MGSGNRKWSGGHGRFGAGGLFGFAEGLDGCVTIIINVGRNGDYGDQDQGYY